MGKAPRITREELARRLEAGNDIQILDVRNSADYAASGQRLPGAIRIPVDELEEHLSELDPAREVVAYCT